MTILLSQYFFFIDLVKRINKQGVKLTFNTVDTSWRQHFTSTFALLSKIMWPFPPIDVYPSTFPPSGAAVRQNPRTISQMVYDSYLSQWSYATRNGGFWKGVNWVNYFSLYFEFILVFWIVCKGCIRSHPQARDWLQGTIVSKSKLSEGHKRDISNKFGGKNTVSLDAPVVFKGLPTRLKASLILSLFMVFGVAIRLCGMVRELLIVGCFYCVCCLCCFCCSCLFFYGRCHCCCRTVAVAVLLLLS